MTVLRFPGVAVLLAALSVSASAQSKKELAAQDQMLSQRISVLESRMLTGDPAAERLMQRLDALEIAQRNLTGEVEGLRFERDNLRAEVAALSGDVRILQDLATRTRIHLDAMDPAARERVRQNPYPPTSQNDLSGSSASLHDDTGSYNGSGAAGETTHLSGVPGAPVLKELKLPVDRDHTRMSALPDSGRRKLAEGDFSGAQLDFRQYLDAVPDAPDADEINYWLGETYYVTGSYADAADAYIISMRKNKQGARAPDAMIRLAGALRALGKIAEACQTLDSFPTQYPDASASVRSKHRTEIARTGCRIGGI
ncbi:MAG: tetratricopeptide repeat protein [Hyphomonadaceae bacterium]|nr:tetratricopeptide repeat protein [Hyphomonadaceae bacterium]MBC6412470.1 tetratricopeptide repeat protein [Hyphomonadaceae bacterium]